MPRSEQNAIDSMLALTAVKTGGCGC